MSGVQVWEGDGWERNSSLINWWNPKVDPSYDWVGEYNGTSVMLYLSDDGGTWEFRYNNLPIVTGMTDREEALIAITRFVEILDEGGNQRDAKQSAIQSIGA